MTRFAGFALVALAAVTYAGTLGYEFVWDDKLSVEGWVPALKTWWSPFFPLSIPQFPYSYYRPLQLISYLIDRATGGGEPWTFHLTTVGLHVVATYLVYRAALRLFDGSAMAWQTAVWAGILFAVHPIHTESVAWMGARPDPMVTCFGLAALLAYNHKSWSALQRSCVASALIFLALLAKESGIALLVLVPASAWALQDEPQARRRRGRHVPHRGDPWTAYVPFVVVAVVYLTMRSIAMRGAEPPAMPDQPVQTVLGALGTYLRLLVVPYPHNAFIADVPKDGVAVISGSLILLVYAALLRRAWQDNSRPLVFSLIWIIVALVPSFGVINMYPTAPLAERYLYVPSVGFCWAFGAAIAAACERGGRMRFAAQTCAALLAVAAFFATLERNPDWRDDYASWKDTAAKNPVDALPMRNFAKAALARGDDAEARRLFERSLELRNDRVGERAIYNNLGTLAFRAGDDDAAERYYRKSLGIKAMPDALFNLGIVILRRAIDPQRTPDAEIRATKVREAGELLNHALAMNPNDPDIYIGLAHVAEATGQSREARRRFEQALALAPPPETEAAVRKHIANLN